MTATREPSDWRRIPVGEFFTLGEFTTWAARRGPHRRPPREVEGQIRDLVRRYLDPARRALGRPIIVASGWRPLDLFPLAEGQTSGHTVGGAADIYSPGLTNRELARFLDRLARERVIPTGGIGVYPAEPGVRDRDDPTVHVDNRAHTTVTAARWPREFFA